MHLKQFVYILVIVITLLLFVNFTLVGRIEVFRFCSAESHFKQYFKYISVSNEINKKQRQYNAMRDRWSECEETLRQQNLRRDVLLAQSAGGDDAVDKNNDTKCNEACVADLRRQLSVARGEAKEFGQRTGSLEQQVQQLAKTNLSLVKECYDCSLI